MPEGQILEQESGMGLEASEQATEKQQKELEHDRPTSADEIQKSTFSTAYGVFATHKVPYSLVPRRGRMMDPRLRRTKATTELVT